jgi:hypothetical protein
MAADAAETAVRRRHAVYLGLCAASIVFSLVFVAPSFHPFSVLWYFPLEHRWEQTVRPRGLAIDWYGRLLWATIAAPIAYAVAALVARRLRRVSTSALTLWTAWMATAALLAAALFVYQLAPRKPTPVPLPEWYEPR